MTDYSSWKVPDLKAELKTRGIPQTGLRLKQQIIDKLVEEDGKAQPEGGAVAPSEPEPESQSETEVGSEAPQEHVPDTASPAQESQSEHSAEEPQKEEPAPQEEPAQPIPTHDEEKRENDTAPEPKVSVDEAIKEEDKPTQDVEMAEAAAPEETAKEEDKPTEDVKVTEAAVPEELAEDEKKPILDTEMTDAAVIGDGELLKPAEQAPADISEPTKPVAPSLVEPSAPVLPQTSEANTGFSTPLPIEEALEDKRTRKRRSQSPVPTPETMAHKKARTEKSSPGAEDLSTQDKETLESIAEEQSASTVKPTARQAPSGPAKDARFRGLFAPTRAAPAQVSPPVGDITMEDAEVEPALHPATAALYIDGLMRPMQPQALRKHLVSLATAPGSEPNPAVIQDFFLDAIKTHCFAAFIDLASASRVRAAIHNTTWPNERNRKTLRADFIPEDRVKEWIQTEEASRSREGPPVRWEVRYESSEGNEGMSAILAESDGLHPRAAPPRPREAGFNRTPPLGPRGSVAQTDRRQSNAPPAPQSQPGQGFKPLDELFESTTTKPKLYYQRVPRKVADKRLDQFDELLSKGSFPRRGGDETRRITFEDDDRFVDIGPEYGARTMQRRQGRGRPGGGRRGRDHRDN
ncbi:hypothetical protein N7466_009589 [Penicillium verhagenii]|uniref:uncharacterized protein n=1 Tax=Penicillium verhagenii TaxID=1562060 RepID=UPI0025452E40|nr:uncharacterized protein N7466_009589 [Penicillium verhagenii]KAJ5921263.1 hypothetical protein N7466_009589 [Penicillium verhagenii]